MNTTVKLLKEHAKSVAVWVGGVVVTAILNLINGVSAWPQTPAQWWQYALTSFGLAFAAWAFPNKITQKQLDKDPHVVGGTVVEEPPVTPPASDIDDVPPPTPGLGGRRDSWS